MSVDLLLIVILGVCYAAMMLERQVSWLANFNSSCVIIIAALGLSTLGLIPQEHVVYDFFMDHSLPVLLALLVLSLDLRDLMKVKKKILVVFAVGALGTVLGGLVSSVLVYPELGINGIKISSQLVASYVGGLENAVAMRDVLEIPNELFISTFTLDNLVTSFWMLMTVTMSGYPPKDEYSSDIPPLALDTYSVDVLGVILTIMTGLVIVMLSDMCAPLLGIHRYLCITSLALAVGQIKGARKYLNSSCLIGTALFSPFFFSLGATGNLNGLAHVPFSIVILPVTIVGIHALVIYLVARSAKALSVETALVSQALIGGSGTAVAFAHAKQWRQGAFIGLVLGILGYALGNYLGVLSFNCSAWLIARIYGV